MCREICLYRTTHPKATIQDIAVHFNIKWSFPLTKSKIRCVLRSSDLLLKFKDEPIDHVDDTQMEGRYCGSVGIIPRDDGDVKTWGLDVHHESNDDDDDDDDGDDNDDGFDHLPVVQGKLLSSMELESDSALATEVPVRTDRPTESTHGESGEKPRGFTLEDAYQGLIRTISYITEHAICTQHLDTLCSVLHTLFEISQSKSTGEKPDLEPAIKQENQTGSPDVSHSVHVSHRDVAEDTPPALEESISTEEDEDEDGVCVSMPQKRWMYHQTQLPTNQVHAQ